MHKSEICADNVPNRDLVILCYDNGEQTRVFNCNQQVVTSKHCNEIGMNEFPLSTWQKPRWRRVWSIILAAVIALFCCYYISYAGANKRIRYPSILSEHTDVVSDSKKQQEIANKLALAFLEGLQRVSVEADARQELSQVQNTTVRNISAANQTDDTSEGQGDSEEDTAVPSEPGFEPAWTGTPSKGSDISEGLRGSNNFILREIDAIGAELAEALADDKSSGDEDGFLAEPKARFFPLGRDRLIQLSPIHAVPPPASSRPDSFTAAGLLPDDNEPDGDADALRVTDTEVPVTPPVAAAALQAGADNGVARIFPDEVIPQHPVPAQPRSHREHTDFDLQGAVPDLLIPAAEYDPALGEDILAPGVQDAAVRSPPPRPVAAVPSATASGSDFPRQWGDEYVDEAAAAEGRASRVQADKTEARDALSGRRYGTALREWMDAGLVDAGLDLSDSRTSVPPAVAASVVPLSG